MKTAQTTSAKEEEKDTTNENVVEIAHLQKAFNGKTVLEDISLNLLKGENLVIMGKSGTGKSVLIKCLVRLIEADKGDIKILGQDVMKLKEHDLNELRKKIGFLFQSAALYDSMSVRENLEFTMRNSKIKDNELKEQVEQVLESVGLADAINKMPAELSGGMRKRVGLARTLILKPEIILYDEPNTGLDPITTREISQLIVDLQKEHHASSMIITHDSECARITGNRIMIIDEGKIVAEGTYEELEHSEDEWVRSFFSKHD